LKPEDKIRIGNEIFQLIYHSHGGFTHDEVYSMPIARRYFFLKCLIEQKKKEQEANKPSSSSPNSVAHPPIVKK